MKILLIDDDPEIAILVRSFAEPQHSVITASRAAEGLSKFRSEQPDVILLDVNMPDESGLVALRKLQGLARQLDRPARILMLTARLDDEVLQHAAVHGASGYIQKPFSKDVLLRSLGTG